MFVWAMSSGREAREVVRGLVGGWERGGKGKEEEGG